MHWVSASSVTGTPRHTSSRKRSFDTSLPASRDQQGQRVEIAGVELDRLVAAPQLAVARIEHETVEAEAAGSHFSAKPQDLLMPLTGRVRQLQAAIMHGDKAMATNQGRMGARQMGPWRLVPWGIAAFLLLLPFVAMRFTAAVQWTGSDFVFMGILLGSVVLGFEFLVRRSNSLAYRVGAAAAIVTGFLTVWVNGAVGMIGSEDNPVNLLFGGVLLIGLIGAIVARFKPAGMARTMVVAAIAQAAIGASGFASDVRGAVFSVGFGALWLIAAGLFGIAARK